MSNTVQDVVREVRDFWRQHTFQIKQQFKKDWERYLLYRIGATAVIITSVVSLIVFFIWLVCAHAMIAAILIWSVIGLLVIGAGFAFVYKQIDKAVRK